MNPGHRRVLLVGCGRMGSSLVRGWIESGAVDRPVAVDPAPQAVPAGLSVVAELAELSDPLPDTILLAVKPQMLDAVLPGLKPRLPNSALVISIAAGKNLAYFADRLGPSVAVVRTMPNTPAAIGRGITVCCAAATVSSGQRATAESLMAAVGQVAWIEDESLMHAVTAVSGSGPAYVFLLIEALTEAGIAAGLPPDLAQQLARATVAGSGELAGKSSDNPAKLRADVTSPGGTTAAALQVLMGANGVGDLMKRAVAAAAVRSAELAGD
jgi:pyrroline-5-carboxylate reductase